MNPNDKKTAYLLLRLALGVNMLVHGAGRLLGNYGKFVADTRALFENSPLPAWSVSAFVSALPFVEAVIGILLTIGLATRHAAIAGSLLMVGLIFGMGTLQKWDVVGLQMDYAFLYFVILFFLEWNHYSIDNRLQGHSGGETSRLR